MIWSDMQQHFGKKEIYLKLYLQVHSIILTILRLNFLGSYKGSVSIYDVGVIDSMTPLITGGGFQQTQVVLVGLIELFEDFNYKF